jgi:SAM-dependent methyltransferase
VLFLSRHFRALNDRYHGADGDRFAAEELLPVARRFLPGGGRALEIGCGYGRNLKALAALPVTVVGCDVSLVELRKARERLAELPPGPRERVALVHQEPWRLPFPDGAFDLVVLWQVLEHVYGRDSKRRVIAECTRVLRSGGHLLIETPNQWFPFDYHDNKFPLVHWIAPRPVREWITWKVRGKRYPPSEYLSLGGYERLVRESPGVARATRATRLYFASGFGEAWRALGGTQVGLKRLIFASVAPLHALMRPFGGSADTFLPSLRVVWRVEKSP